MFLFAVSLTLSGFLTLILVILSTHTVSCPLHILHLFLDVGRHMLERTFFLYT